jgi:hypothetical protein
MDIDKARKGQEPLGGDDRRFGTSIDRTERGNSPPFDQDIPDFIQA